MESSTSKEEMLAGSKESQFCDTDRESSLKKHTGFLDSVLGEGLDEGGLVGLGVDELVVQDLDARVVALELSDLVGNGLGIGEGGNVLSDTGKAEGHVLGVASAQLGLALLTQNNKLEALGVGTKLSAHVTRKTRVDTTTETLVGRADNQESLTLGVLGGLGLGLLENLVGSLTVGARGVHGTLSAGELGRGDNLHGLGDLLDVADRLETALDFTESGEVGGIGDGLGPVKRQRISTKSICDTRWRIGGIEGKVSVGESRRAEKEQERT